MKCQVTWLWKGIIYWQKCYLSHVQTRIEEIELNSCYENKRNNDCALSLTIIILYPHPINPIYGANRSFEVLRSVKPP